MRTLIPWTFDPDAHRWRAEPRSCRVELERLTLVTYNVWFGEHRLERRLAALMEEVGRCDPDLVALQEVTAAHLELLLADARVRRLYRVSDAQGDTVSPHGVLLLSRLPLEALRLMELPSGKDRKALVADLGVAGRPLRLGAVHLESSEANTTLRLRQLDELEPHLDGAAQVVVMGDLNFDPEAAGEQARIEARYTDLWTALRPGEAGYTEDTDVNRMRLLHKSREKQVRFDRILLRPADRGWRPRSIRRIGTGPVSADEPDLFPSDHFGLCAELQWTNG